MSKDDTDGIDLRRLPKDLLNKDVLNKNSQIPNRLSPLASSKSAASAALTTSGESKDLSTRNLNTDLLDQSVNVLNHKTLISQVGSIWWEIKDAIGESDALMESLSANLAMIHADRMAVAGDGAKIHLNLIVDVDATEATNADADDTTNMPVRNNC